MSHLDYRASKSPSSSLYHPNPLVTPCPFPPDSAILSSASKLASGGAAILGTRPFLPFKTRLPVSLCMRAKSLHSCRTLCNAVDCSPPGSSVRGILQARILEWVASPFSRGSDPGIKSASLMPPVLAGRFFTTSATWEAQDKVYGCG